MIPIGRVFVGKGKSTASELPAPPIKGMDRPRRMKLG
jgi:hypothetical protein